MTSSPSTSPSGTDGGDRARGDAEIKAEEPVAPSGCGAMERGANPAGPGGGAERAPGGAALRGQPAGGCGPWEMRDRLGTGGFGNVCLYQHQVGPGGGEGRGGQGWAQPGRLTALCPVGLGRPGGHQVLPVGAQRQEQGPLVPRDRHHEEVSEEGDGMARAARGQSPDQPG